MGRRHIEANAKCPSANVLVPLAELRYYYLSFHGTRSCSHYATDFTPNAPDEGNGITSIADSRD